MIRRKLAITILVILSPAGRARAQDSLPSLSTLESRVKAGDSLDGLTQFRLALQYEFKGRYDDAEKALRTAIAADPRQAQSYALLGELPYVRDKDLSKQERRHEVPPDRVPAVDSAKRLRARSFAVDPFGELHLFEGDPLPQGAIVLPNPNSPATLRYLARVGELAYFAERYDVSYGALDMYWTHRYGSTPADSIPTWLLLFHGLAATQEMMYPRAASDLQTLVNRGSTEEEADTLLRVPLNANAYRYLLAIIKERDNKPVDAIQLYHDIIARDLGFYMAHARLGQLYRQYKMWDSATVEAQAAVEADPDDPSLLLDLGVIDAESGHLPEAAANFKRAIALDPRYPEVYYRLGLATQALGQIAEARDALTHFVSMAPRRMTIEVADAKKRLDSLR